MNSILKFELLKKAETVFPGIGIIYERDQWNLRFHATSAESPSGYVINFSSLPAWLQKPAKAFILWGITQDYSNSWCRAYITAINHLADYLKEYRQDIRQLAHLERSAAQGFKIYLTEMLSQANACRIAERVDVFAQWVHEQYGVAESFKPNKSRFRLNQKKILVSKRHNYIPLAVREQLIAAVGRLHAQIRAKFLGKKKTGSTEFLYLQILKFLIFTPLRVSQILLLTRDPIRESRDGEAAGIWIKYMESKGHLDQQEVFVPEPAEIMRDAVKVCLEHTKHLHQQFGLNYLFLTSRKGGAQGGGFVRNISKKSLELWLNGRQDAEGNVVRKGFVHRANILYEGHYYTFRLHQPRHTLANRLYESGAGFGIVSDYLHHRSPVMTDVYVDGTSRHGEEIQAMHQRRAGCSGKGPSAATSRPAKQLLRCSPELPSNRSQTKKKKNIKKPTGFNNIRKESIIDGKSTTERVELIYKEMNELNVRMTIQQFCNKADISPTTLRTRFPHLCQELRELRSRKKNPGIQLLPFDKTALRQSIEAEWAKTLNSKGIVTLKGFAEKCGINRNVIYIYFPQIAKKIKKHNKKRY